MTVQSFVTNMFLLVSSSVQSKQQYTGNCFLCAVKVKKENKNIQERTLSSFITIPHF